MNFFKRKSLIRNSMKANFDMLRAGLEVEIERPASVAITSSTALDGPEIASRGLAHSLASTGYSTILIDTTTVVTRTRPMGSNGRTFEDIVKQVETSSTLGSYVTLSLGDVKLQQTTSQRDVQSAIESLKTKFDYIVIAVEHGGSSPFATSLLATADVVLATIRTGRKEQDSDSRLADSLDRLGSRFLGVVALESAILNADPLVLPNASEADKRRSGAVSLDQEFARREVAEWPT